jgi:hypothetical protein
LIGEKKPASIREGGADIGAVSVVFSFCSSSLLTLWMGERLGDSSDLALFFLTFLPGAGELVGVVGLSLGWPSGPPGEGW